MSAAESVPFELNNISNLSVGAEVTIENVDYVAVGRKPRWRQQIRAAWPGLVMVLTPILLAPLLIINWHSKSARCGYVILVMAVYWATEVLPISVTALIPMAAMPIFGIARAVDVCPHYFEDASIMFFSGLMLAVAVERWNLHKRIALRVLMYMGTNPIWILFGFMLITAVLSMWISNIGTTAMVVTITVGVLDELAIAEEQKYCDENVVDVTTQPIVHNDTKEKVAGAGVHCNGRTAAAATYPKAQRSRRKEFKNFSTCLILSIALAANIGGSGTLIGCGPTVTFAGLVPLLFGPDTGVNFITYMSMAVPAIVLNLLSGYLTLAIMYIGPKKMLYYLIRRKGLSEDDTEQNVCEQVFRREYAKLGRMTFAEGSVLFLFCVVVVLWITKKPDVFPGWSTLLGHTFASESSAGIAVCVLMFMWPSQRPNYLCFRRSTDTTAPVSTTTLLDWQTVNEKLPWSVVLMVGGCFAVAHCCKESGLSSDIGEFLSSLNSQPQWLILLLLSVLGAVVTTFVGIHAASTILLPIVAELGRAVGMNPLAPMLCITFSTAFTYVLPVSIPCNAIVYAYGRFPLIEMVKPGVIVIFLHIAILQLTIHTWGRAIFHLDTFPEWAKN